MNPKSYQSNNYQSSPFSSFTSGFLNPKGRKMKKKAKPKMTSKMLGDDEEDSSIVVVGLED